MTPFLKEVAAHLYEKHGTKISQIHVVLPTRRACLYFKHYLSQVVNETIMMPEILSMDDFIKQMADVEWLDQVNQLFELYRSYKIFDKNKENNLERFAPLGLAILKDFNMIDKNLTPQAAKQMFEYLDELKAIERWGEELGKPIEVKEGSTVKDFFSFWKHLHASFFHFRNKLLDHKQAYSGLGYRAVSEQVEKLIDAEIHYVAFAGFNQMSRTEEEIIRKLLLEKKAYTFWDADAYYMDNPHHEAGDFIRKYTKRWLPPNFRFNRQSLKTDPRHVRIIQVSNQVAQAKLSGDILKTIIDDVIAKGQVDEFKKSINHTAIMMPDQNMLLPILNSLPNKETSKHPFDCIEYTNITTGLSIFNTPLFGLIDAIFRLQDNITPLESGAYQFYYKDILKILTHPLIRTGQPAEVVQQINEFIHKIQLENWVYLESKQLSEHETLGELFSKLFHTWQGSVNEAIQHFYNLIELFTELQEGKPKSFDHEFLFQYYTLLHQLETVLYQQKEQLTIRTFRQLLFELLRKASVPFTGEPISPIQIMGMLESRTLDFENVILISCNEGILPQGKLLDSVIPFDLRKTFGMPTHKESDSSVAYVFYRLFHRAKNIWLIYTDPSAVRGGKEKSRFLMQVEQEFTPKNGFINTTIEHQKLVLGLPNQYKEERTIIKDDEVLEMLRERLKKGISPSAINTYLKSPLEFFQRSVLKLEETTQVEEDLARHTFGTLVHETLDRLFQPFIGKEVTESMISNVRTDQDNMQKVMVQVIEEECGGIVVSRGKNYILKKVAERLIDNFLVLQEEKEGAYFLIDQENFLKSRIIVSLADGSEIPFTIWGKADRIDCIGDEIRVVDYKTGSFDDKNLQAKRMEDLLLNPEKGKIVQLLIYKYLLVKSIINKEIKHLPKDFDWERYQLKSGFYFFTNLKRGFIEYKLDDEPQQRDEFIAYVEQFLSLFVQDLMNAEQPITSEPSDFGWLMEAEL